MIEKSLDDTPIHRLCHMFYLAIVALLCTILLCSCSSTGYKWTIQFQPQGLLVFWKISVVDSQNVWAIGHELGGDNEIYSYDGTSWNLSCKTEEYLEGIFALNSDHVWVVGGDEEKCIGVIYYFNGTAWNRQYETSDQYGIGNIFALDDKNVWAVSNEKIYYYDGSVWEEQATPGNDVNSIHATDTSHVWAACWKSIYFWDGASWAKQLDSEANLLEIVGKDQDNLWAVGGVPDQDRGMIYYYDGSAWAQQLVTDWRLRSICVGDSGNVWAAGFKSDKVDYQPTSAIFRNNGLEWQIEHKIQDMLSDISSSSDENIWAVGGVGIYLGTI